MEQRSYRLEGLACYIGKGIADGIATHNKHESSISFPPAAREEVFASLAEAILRELDCDEADVDYLHTLMRRRLDPNDYLEWL
jgi:hypothetical protein